MHYPLPVAPTTTPEIVARLVRKLGSQTAVARAMNTTDTPVSRWLSGEQTMNAENCLIAADILGENPSDVLRAAGKGDYANLLERLYGAPRPAAEPESVLSADAQALAEDFDRLSPRDRGIVMQTIGAMFDVAPFRSTLRRPRRAGHVARKISGS